MKCRIGANMIWDAEASGRLKSGMTLVEPTSGKHRHRPRLRRRRARLQTDPDHAGVDEPGTTQVLKALGAELVLTEPAKGMKGAIQKAEELVAGDPGSTSCRSSSTTRPTRRSMRRPPPGDLNDTEGAVDVLVSGSAPAAPSPASRATSRTPGQADPRRGGGAGDLAGDQPDPRRRGEVKPAPHKIQGIGAGFVPKNLDLSLVDRVEKIGDDEAKNMALRLMQEEGILCGISSGAAMAAAVRLAEEPNMQGKTIVVILPRFPASAIFRACSSTACSANRN